MVLLDGKALAQKLQGEIQQKVNQFIARYSRPPGLAAVRVGDNEASRVYVNRKVKMCGEVGLYSQKVELPEDISEVRLLDEIKRLNQQETIDGILVQLPLPKQISTDRILESVLPEKDVDGFHPINVGHLSSGRPVLVPCTPLGVIRLLDEFKIPIEGAEAVVVGRSNIVGKPLAHLLLSRNATVTICHSRTHDLPQVCRRADILAAAVGKAGSIRGDWIKPGAAVIDVGINRTAEGRLTGDVMFDEAATRAGWITPVPGGVGPLTIAMLLSNTLKAATLRKERPE